MLPDGEPVGIAGKAIVFVRSVLSAVTRGLAHVVMLPVEVLVFLPFDLLVVNLKKTGIFGLDCRGERAWEEGGPCQPAYKYTHRVLFQLVCRDLAKAQQSPFPQCMATEHTRIYFARSVCTALAIAAVAIGGLWATIRFWPKMAPGLEARDAAHAIAAERVRNAEALFAEGDYLGALSSFEGARRLDPYDKEVCYKMGLCWERLGRNEAALHYFREAADGENPHLPAVKKMVLHLYETGDVDQAARYAERAAEMGGADGPTYAVLADLQIWAGDMHKAAEYLRAATDQSPKSSIVRAVRAHYLIAKDELGEAQELLDSLADEPSVALLAGVYELDLLWKTGRGEEAIKELQRLARTYSELAWPSVMLMEAYFGSGQRQKAIAEAERVAEEFRGLPAVILEVARALARHGEDGKALRLALSCKGNIRFSAPAHVLAAEIYLRRGLRELAQDHAECALSKQPDDLSALLLAGKVALSGGDAQQALKRFQEAVEAAPQHAQANLLLGSTYLKMGQSGAALEYLKRACELNPDSGQSHYEYGLALAQADRKEEARQEFLEAARLLQNPYIAYTRLGMIAQEEGDLTKAMEYYEKAIDADAVRAYMAGNNLADLLLSQNRHAPLALALAHWSYMMSRGSNVEDNCADTFARALLKTGYPTRAVSLARFAVVAEPDNVDRRLRLVVAEAAAGNLDEAMAHLDKIAQLEPDSEQARQIRELVERLRQRRKAAEGGQAPQEGGGKHENEHE